jgi:hypothetical protein
VIPAEAIPAEARWTELTSHGPLVGVFSKLLRADHHLNELREFLGSHFADKAHELRADIYTEPQATLRIRGKIYAPSIRTQAIVGDALNNLRSALDHLACRLIERECAPRVSAEELAKLLHDHYFPTNDVAPSADKAGTPGPLAIRPYVSASAYSVIEDCQPYTWGENARFHPLYVLKKMTNADKHQNLNFTIIKADSVIASGKLVPVSGRLVTSAILDDGAEMTFVPDHKVNVDAKLTLRVAFNDGLSTRPEAVFNRLTTLRTFVRYDVVARLTRECGSPSPFQDFGS